jgi:Tfp pilus assembly protein PilN
MRSVNLLPKDAARIRRPVNRVALAGVAGGAAVSMVLGALYLSAHSTVRERTAELAAARAELAATPKPSVQPSANQLLAKERQARVTALTKALGTRIGWDRLLREISSVLPADVWLTELQARGPTAASAVSGGTSSSSSPLTIRGYTYTQEGVARFLARMQLVPDLTAVELESSSLTQLNLQDVYQFTIKAQVRRTGAIS